MHVSYSGFGAITPVPGLPKITIFLRVTREYGIVGTPVYDDTVSVPEIRWGAPVGRAPFPSAVVAFPPKSRVPGTINLTAQKMPVPGEVVKLPGLSGTEAPLPAPIVTRPPMLLQPQPAQPPAMPPAPVVTQPPAMPPAPVVTQPPAQPPAPPPQMPIQPTGQTAVIDIPGAGPTPLPVFIGPVPAPSIQPGPSGLPVVVIPKQQSNLLTMPTREAVRRRLVEEDQEGLPPGVYNPDEYFPPVAPRRLPVKAVPAQGRARPAMTAADEDVMDVALWEIRGGETDLFDRPYPTTRPRRTLPVAPPSRSGLVPTAAAMPKAREVKAETDGTLLVQVPASMPLPTPRQQAEKTSKAGIVLPIAGAGGGFLIAGPIGGAIGLAAALLLGRKG